MKMVTSTDIDRLVRVLVGTSFAFGMAAGVVLAVLCMRWAVLG